MEVVKCGLRVDIPLPKSEVPPTPSFVGTDMVPHDTWPINPFFLTVVLELLLLKFCTYNLMFWFDPTFHSLVWDCTVAVWRLYCCSQYCIQSDTLSCRYPVICWGFFNCYFQIELFPIPGVAQSRRLAAAQRCAVSGQALACPFQLPSGTTAILRVSKTPALALPSLLPLTSFNFLLIRAAL